MDQTYKRKIIINYKENLELNSLIPLNFKDSHYLKTVMRCKIGLIGLGSMGTGLAKNLSANGISVAVWDKDVTISLQSESKKFAKPIINYDKKNNIYIICFIFNYILC